MILRPCSHENDVLQALKDGHWPEGCAPELRAHVETCPSCSDLVLVTNVFQRAKDESRNQPPSGSPGLIWWRAQLQRRHAATRSVSQPITVAETFALVVNLIVAVVFIGSQYDHGLRWKSWGLTPSRVLHHFSAGFVDWNLALLIPAGGLLVFLSCLALYLASEKH